MASIFISHSSSDAEICDAIGRHLQQRGHSPLFVHRHPGESDFVGDQDWAAEVGERAATYEIFVALLSESWFNSDECRLEAKFASRSGRTLLPLRLDPDAPVPDWARPNIIPFSREPSDEQWRTLDQALTRVGADAEAFEPHPDRKPFPGLNAFERQDAAVYFGRDGDIRAVRERLRRMRRARETELDRQCLIVGPSGAGKSSLMRAGVLARLEREPHEWLCPPTVTPSGDLTEALTDSLTSETGLSRPRIQTALTSGVPDDLIALAQAARERRGQPDATLLLSIDQMEEAFAPQLIEDTLALLRAQAQMEVALDEPMPLVILGTLRADRYAGLCDRGDIAALPLATYRVAPLPIEYLSEVIRGPLRVWRQPVRDVDIEPAVVDRMLVDARRIGGGAEADSGDVLPLVAIALRQLWDDHAQTDWFAGLTEKHYEETGGLSAIIDAQAKRALREIHRQTGFSAEEVFDALIPAVATADTHGNRVRAWSPESVFDTQMKPALRILCEARLLHTDTRGSTQDGTAETVYSVAHEVVLRQWTGLARALEQQTERLTLMARIREEAATWARVSRGQESADIREGHTPTEDANSYLLLEGDRLAQAQAINWPDSQPADLPKYIAACAAKQEARAETLAQRERRVDQARQQYIAARAIALSDSGNHLSALRLALSVYPYASASQPPHPHLTSTLITAAVRNPFYRSWRAIRQKPPHTLALSPDSRLVAYVENQPRDTIVLENPTSDWRGSATLPASITCLAWSWNGTQLAASTIDGQLQAWDTAQGQSTHSASLPSSAPIASLAWSPHNTHLAIGDASGFLYLWEFGTDLSRDTSVSLCDSSLDAISWSPCGTWIATCDANGVLRVWQASTLKHPANDIPDMAPAYEFTFPDSDTTAPSWELHGSRFAVASAAEVYVFEQSPNDAPIANWTYSTLDTSPSSLCCISWQSAPTSALVGYDMSGTLHWWLLRNPESHRTLPLSLTAPLPVPHDAISTGGTVLTRNSLRHSRQRSGILRNNEHEEEYQIAYLHKVAPNGLPFDAIDNTLRTAVWAGPHTILTGHSTGELRCYDIDTGLRWTHSVGQDHGPQRCTNLSNHSVNFLTSSRDIDRAVAIASDGVAHYLSTDLQSATTFALNGSYTCRSAGFVNSARFFLIIERENQTWLRLYQTSDLSVILETPLPATSPAIFSPDGRMLLSQRYFEKRGRVHTQLVLYNAHSGDFLRESTFLHEEIRQIAWSPDSTRIVTGEGEGGRVRLWSLDPLEPSGSPLANHGPKERTQWDIWEVRCLSWSPDGSRIASGGVDQMIKIIDLSGTELQTINIHAHNYYVEQVTWSHDGMLLISGSNDGTVRLWDVRNGEPICDPLKGIGYRGEHLRLSPRGDRMFSLIKERNELLLWTIPWECRIADRDLPRHVAHEHLGGNSALTTDELEIVNEVSDQLDPDIVANRWLSDDATVSSQFNRSTDGR